MSETADVLTCKELVEVVTDYVEGAMDAGDRERFEGHVEDCPGCRAIVTQFRTTIELTGRLTEDQVSDAQLDAMREVFRRWRRTASDVGG